MAAVLYLLVVVVSATRAGMGAAVWAALLSFTCWNFFFVHPTYTFYIAESKSLLTLLTYLAIAVITGQLAAGARQRAIEAQERERLARQAAEALGQLEAERLKASLLSSISHDLRTPLASIKAAATSIGVEDATTDDAQRRVLAQSIAQNADRLNNFVSNLLDISRLEAGAWQPNKEPYPFIEILGTVLGRLTDAEAARFELDIPADLPLVPLDEVQIQQVLWNLIENALKYAPDGTPFHLRVRVQGNVLEVSLRDHGSGIPVGEGERIFQKFYRAHDGVESGPPGVGIGLTICQQIIVAHGGRIRAFNAPGGGAVFTFTLPLTEGEVRGNKGK